MCLGVLEYERKNSEVAFTYYQRALKEFHGMEDRYNTLMCISYFVALLPDTRQPEQAILYNSALELLALQFHTPVPLLERNIRDEKVHSCLQFLTESQVDQLRSEGAKWTLEETVEKILQREGL